jgi:hypothetical protein
LLKILGALDRYHGLAARAALPEPAAEPLRLAAAAPALALTHAAPAPQPIEPIRPTVAEKGAPSALKSLDAELKSPIGAATRGSDPFASPTARESPLGRPVTFPWRRPPNAV